MNDNVPEEQNILEFVAGHIDLKKLNPRYVGLWVFATLVGAQEFDDYQYTYRLFPRDGEMGKLVFLHAVPEHLFKNALPENDEKQAYQKNTEFEEREQEMVQVKQMVNKKPLLHTKRMEGPPWDSYSE